MGRKVARADFRYVQRLLKERTGVLLDEGKEYLVSSRLGSLCYQHKIELSELLQRSRKDPELCDQILDLLLNHETSFFRDWSPFEGIRKHLLSELCEAATARGEHTLRFWCCACSTGQEPYSLAMLCRESLDLSRWRVEITATDVSERTLDKAQRGEYSALDVNRGLPSQALLKHFDQVGLNWRVRSEVREMIDFRPLNLIEEWPSLPPFDLVLLRNVLIYFDQDSRAGIFEQLKRVLRPSGYLLTGSAEFTMNLTRDFESRTLDRTIYFRLKRGS